MALTTKLPFIALLVVGSCAAQAPLVPLWEVGGFAGYSFYRNGTLTTPAGEGHAGFGRGVSFGALLGHDTYRHVGGEVRYTRTDNTLRVNFQGQQARMSGDSHTIHYDFLVHAAPRGTAVRPFLAAGAGGKYFRGTGPERAFQPLMQFAVLTRTNDWKGVVSLGGGVKVRVARHVLLRVEFRDYISPFPTRLITPMRGSSVSGWMHNLVPMGGISAIF